MEIPTWAVYAGAWLAALLLLLKGLHLHLRCSKLNLPPGPKPWPIIGNLNLIGSLPHRSINELSQKYGPLLQLKFGSYPFVVASSVEMAKEILKTHDLTFADRPKTTSAMYATYNCSDILWSPYGPYLRQARKMLVMELFSAKRLESFEYIRIEEMRAFIKGLYASSSNQITLKDRLSDANIKVMSRIVFGKNYLDEAQSKTSILTPIEFRKILDEVLLFTGAMNIGDLIPWIGFFDLQGYVRRVKAMSKKVDEFLEHVIDEHSGKSSKGVEDYIGMLLKMADDPNLEVKVTRTRVKAISLDLMVGGTESSAITVEWAMSELLKHPKTLKKAVEELDRVIGRERWVEEKDIPYLPYIEAILKETMRMHPAAPMLVPREAHEDCKIASYDIPAGTRALVNVWAIGRDPTLWDDPEEFNPERFIGKKIDVKGNDFELLPFGAGRRMCPAYVLGKKVMMSSLANLLHGFTWTLPNNMKPEDLNMEEIFGLSTPRKIPIEAIVEPRLPPHMYA